MKLNIKDIETPTSDRLMWRTLIKGALDKLTTSIFFISNFIEDFNFLVSGRDLACQQDVSLALTKTPPIQYYMETWWIARSAITRG